MEMHIGAAARALPPSPQRLIRTKTIPFPPVVIVVGASAYHFKTPTNTPTSINKPATTTPSPISSTVFLLRTHLFHLVPTPFPL